MQVVYTPAHLAHDITVETFMGVAVPANEVAERAESIRATLDADGGYERVEPTEHGEAPITAVHDPGLVRFLETAWSEVRRQALERAFLSADTYPNHAMFEGMSADAVRTLVREPEHVAGRAGYWGLDSAAPLVAGTYVAARGAVDVALTTVDLVLGGEYAAYGLCRPPGHHAARSMYGGYCYLQQRGDRRARHHPGDRASASRSSTSTTTTGTGASRSSGAAATSGTSRSTPIRSARIRTSSAGPTRRARAKARART